MDALSIQRNLDFSVERRTSAAKVEKQAPAASDPARAASPSDPPVRLDADLNPAERFAQSRLILQTGESVLAEVYDVLARMDGLLRQSGGSSGGLDAELAALGREIDRLLAGAAADGVQLFLPDGAPAPSFPDWLLNGLAQGIRDRSALLSSLNLRADAGPELIRSAVLQYSLGANRTTDYLATLYLGAVIAGGGTIPERLDEDAMLDGLRRLLELVDGGMGLDQAISELTNGTFTSLFDFEARFSGGTAPGLTDFLTGLLLSEDGSALPSLPGLLDGLAGLGGLDLDLWAMLDSLQLFDVGAGTAETPLPDALPGPGLAPGEAASNPPAAVDAAENAAENAAAAPDAAHVEARDTSPAVNVPPSSLQFGALEVSGRDLSGVVFADGALTLNGSASVILRGGQPGLVIHLDGPGPVTLENVDAAALVVDAPGARVLTAGHTTLEQIVLPGGAALSLDVGGQLNVKQLQAEPDSHLRLLRGALLLDGEQPGLPAETVLAGTVLAAPAILSAGAAQIAAQDGREAPKPFDLVLSALLPGVERLIAATVDGAPARLLLAGQSPAQLWLNTGPDGSNGYPAHMVTLTGVDALGNRASRPLYLRWNGAQFLEVPMYPNPFQISGGVEDEDWSYDPASRTLRILTARAMTISGGAGMDANLKPFSGRIVLADGLGATELTLDGAVCQVSAGRAFDLGHENQVTLLLRRENRFQSGAGCAGLSLGDGTALLIDAAPDEGGTLTASGGFGGAGIGRDRSAGPDSRCRVSIRGGAITARTFGAGAGIGAGRDGALGPISIGGGTIFASAGRGGGAAIGGAPGGPVGDITISGGEITVSAPSLPSAIGAGKGSGCGEVRIARAARIINKDAPSGPSEPKKPKGIPLELGNETILLPQFHLSAGNLCIQTLDVSTPSALHDAHRNVSEASKRLWRIHLAYSEMFSRLEEHLNSLWNVHSSLGGPIRTAGTAGELLTGVRQAVLERPSRLVEGRQQSAAGEIYQLMHKD